MLRRHTGKTFKSKLGSMKCLKDSSRHIAASVKASTEARNVEKTQDKTPDSSCLKAGRVYTLVQWMIMAHNVLPQQTDLFARTPRFVN